MEKRYAIIDVETTGGIAARDRITEIGIVIHDGYKTLDTFKSLVNPERAIPSNITQITGITNEMVFNAPKFFEIAKKVVEITEGAIFVAHNVRFDYCFIKEEFKRLGYTYTRKLLCTVRLSRQTFPELRSHSLGNLIKHFGIKTAFRHRAFDDAKATAELFEIILQKEESEERIDHIVNLGIKESQLPANITLEQLHQLPEACGVYYFHDDDNEIVYVGKSLNIKKRVMEHFAKKTTKASKLQECVYEITYEITGSEMVALLFESNEIKYYMPKINKAQRRKHMQYALIKFYDEEGYLNFEVVKNSVKVRKTKDIISVFPNLMSTKNSLRRIQEKFELCVYLCAIEKVCRPCFNFHLQQCHGACAQKEAVASYNSRALEASEAINMVFEESFFLIDTGRNPDEKSVVWVQQGIYQGFGYIDAEEINGNLELLRDAIRPYPCNPETTRIIRTFLSKKKQKGIKVIPISKRAESALLE